MKKSIQLSKYIVLLFFSFYIESISAQNINDTIHVLKEIPIFVYPSQRHLFTTPASVNRIDAKTIHDNAGNSLLYSINIVPGVRMEERSPGSYRLSLRGSLMRSPFGVRNVKIYIDEFPFTDAGGNTYLNLLDLACINHIEVAKGPDGSLFGANTGGVVLIGLSRSDTDTGTFSAGINGGSFGMMGGSVLYKKKYGKYRLEIAEAFRKSEGYRNNSSLQRYYAQAIQQWNFKKKQKLKLLALYSDLSYRTPGGLTLKQVELDPRSARPGTKFLPGAEEQKAGIKNNTFFGGILYEASPWERVRTVLSTSGSLTDFENPFITNYEVRDEKNFNTRFIFEWRSKTDRYIDWKWNTGAEGLYSQSEINNYGNKAGIPDTLQVSDNLKAGQYFYFSQFSAALGKRWIAEASVSLNNYEYRYIHLFPSPASSYTRTKLKTQVMPRLAVLYNILPDNLVWRASAGMGYSPPTLAEIRPSGNSIYNGLQPETGLNWETGIRLRDDDEKLLLEVSAYYFQMTDAIVRRTDSAGAEFFMNAGGTEQPGFEIQLSSHIISSRSTGVIRKLSLNSSFSYSGFHFSNYKINNTDYTGNELTGVPRITVVSGIRAEFPPGIRFSIQHHYTDRIPLDDGNSVYAEPYHLLQARAGWKFRIKNMWELEIYAGGDNLLDESYSLGNDLNAFGGRYYNPAPGRNYYAGLTAAF